MSHSIEELKRQMDQASSVHAQAQRDLRERRLAYEEALIAEHLRKFEADGGVIGKTVVRASDWGGRMDKSLGAFFVMGGGVSYGRATFKLAKIKKDGTPSNAPVGRTPEKVFILPEDNQ